jgi:hypothetical protein
LNAAEVDQAQPWPSRDIAENLIAKKILNRHAPFQRQGGTGA